MIKYFFLAMVPVFLSGCRMRVSLSEATIPTDAKTISVGFFANNTTLGAPSLSQRFTEKLKDVVSQQTNLALIKQNGDLQFEGSIIDYNVTPVAVQATDQAAANRLTITVQVKYINKFDAQKNFDQSFSRFADLSSAEAISSKENELVAEIYRQITEDVFNKAFNNW